MTILPKTPAFSLAGKRALVTGAGRGLGLAMAAALAEHGAHVVLAARSAEQLQQAVAAIGARSGSAEALVLDVTDIGATKAALSELPAFDILVNNAGTNRPKPFTEVSEDDFDAIFDLNVRSAFFVAQAVVTGMQKAQKQGSIVHISSQMGHVGAPNRVPYCASKHAIEGLSKAMAVELGPSGIRVNTICPTFIETPLTAPYFEDEAFKASVLGKIKLGRLGQMEDVMGAVVFLASDASALITGTALKIDGGWTAE